MIVYNTFCQNCTLLHCLVKLLRNRVPALSQENHFLWLYLDQIKNFNDFLLASYMKFLTITAKSQIHFDGFSKSICWYYKWNFTANGSHDYSKWRWDKSINQNRFIQAIVRQYLIKEVWKNNLCIKRCFISATDPLQKDGKKKKRQLQNSHTRISYVINNFWVGYSVWRIIKSSFCLSRKKAYPFGFNGHCSHLLSGWSWLCGWCWLSRCLACWWWYWLLLRERPRKIYTKLSEKSIETWLAVNRIGTAITSCINCGQAQWHRRDRFMHTCS